MQKPLTVYDNEEYHLRLGGNLSQGGIITNQPSSLILHFACVQFRESTTDLQLNLDFGDGKEIELYLNKECNSVETIQEYFTVLYVIYWIIIILIVLLIIAVLLHYLQNNEMTLAELFDHGKRYTFVGMDWVVQKYYEYRYPDREHNDFVQLDKYTEPDTLDIQITAGTSEKIKEKTDYGAL